MELEDVRLGDTVRLRNGETIPVAHKMSGYSDRDGDHAGPFLVPPKTFDRYALSDVVEVVERNERVCRYCGEGVTASNPETDFCVGCHYSGRPLEDARHDLFKRLRLLPNVASAGVWHTGGGCFLLAVTFTDERLVTVTGDDAGLPEPGEPWKMLVVSPSQDAWDEWDEDELDIREGEWSDDDLLREAERIAGAA